MSEKELALFLREVGIIITGNDTYLNIEMIDKVNRFIYQTYLEDKKSLRVICPFLPLIEECMLNDIPFIHINLVLYLMNKYRGIENYAKLVEEVGEEKDKKINALALKCVEYRNKLLARTKKNPPASSTILQ